ncbi:MAG: hypothetical protein M1826_000692 [Phylliscum demangeonii]|nr:MAG: hypothetical protein M1826_000692 [Phylliscum demangeonii]
MADAPASGSASVPGPTQGDVVEVRMSTPNDERVYNNPAAPRAAAVWKTEPQVAAALEETNQKRAAAGKLPILSGLVPEVRSCTRCIKDMVLDVRSKCEKVTPQARCGRCAGLKKECPPVPVSLYPRLAQLERMRAKYPAARGAAKRTLRPRIVIAAHRLSKQIDGEAQKKKGTGGSTTVEPEAICAPLLARAKFERSLIDAIRGLVDATNLAAKNEVRKWGPLPHGDIPAENKYGSLEWESEPESADEDGERSE